jgi:hypothetical protein
MELGVHLPHIGPQATQETVFGFARRMEPLGYHSLRASHHVVIPRRCRRPAVPRGNRG